MIVNTIPHSEPPYDTWRIDFKYQGASANIVILLDDRKSAFLYDLLSTNRRNGEAAALLREIDEYCLAHQITLFVIAVPYDVGTDGPADRKQLKAWYEKVGAWFWEYDEGDPVLLLGDHDNR